MKLSSYADVRDLLRAYLPSAALGAALELGLFWKLAEQPHRAETIAQEMGISVNRCRYWLELLCQLGVLEERDQCFALSEAGRAAIVDARSRETWSLLAQFERENYLAGNNLAAHLQQPESVWQLQGVAQPDYVQQMVASPDRARRFTRMLYELHQPLAKEIGETLDMTRVHRLMDVGGGSGVVSLELLRRHPDLRVVVVDIPNVCAAGREIAKAQAMSERITYYPADILADELPSGFDMVLECDVALYEETLLRKLAGCLNPGGRFVIVGDIPEKGNTLGLAESIGDFKSALHDPDYVRLARDEVSENLGKAGLIVELTRPLSAGGLLLMARKR